MGLLSGLLPTPKNIPPNITPHTNGWQDFGGRVMTNLPIGLYGGGLTYDALGTLWHAINGTLGQHGPAPSLPGRLMQYAFPGIGADSDAGNSNYIGLGDPVNQAQPQQPNAAGLPAPAPGLPAPSGPGWNAMRPGFAPTFQQLMNPGSAIGPWGGGNTNPYQGQFVHPSGGTDTSPTAAAFSSWVNSRNIK